MPSVPIEIKVQKKQKRLVIEYSDKQSYELSFEYLRVHSPSAEVKGHGRGQEVLQLNKENVSIESVLPVGNYAIKVIFDDGHDSGIYTWKYLQELGENKAKYWRAYLDRVKASRYTSI
jgi:DUF971 family protein